LALVLQATTAGKRTRDCMGWTGHGGAAKEWDRSALGWDDAWNNEDDRKVMKM
jgi:hypothetical protein